MATENLNQSGASAVADSAKEETAALNESAGPDNAAAEPRAAADASQTAQDNPTPTDSAATATADQAGDPGNDPEAGGGDFSALLENYEREQAASKQEGEIVRGTVVGVSDKYVM